MCVGPSGRRSFGLNQKRKLKRSTNNYFLKKNSKPSNIARPIKKISKSFQVVLIKKVFNTQYTKLHNQKQRRELVWSNRYIVTHQGQKNINVTSALQPCSN